MCRVLGYSNSSEAEADEVVATVCSALQQVLVRNEVTLNEPTTMTFRGDAVQTHALADKMLFPLSEA